VFNIFRIVSELKTAESDPIRWNPCAYWILHLDHSESSLLARVALVLLQISASEAAVERTFSAQDQIHSKKRNRLLDDNVEQELFIKFNHRAIHKKLVNTTPGMFVCMCVCLYVCLYVCMYAL
jgi:hypothetical protein